MLLCILGFSGSGKDTITQELISKFGFKKVIQHTNRPRRACEIKGIDYHFISTAEFEKGIKNCDFVTYRHFNTREGKWYYGVKNDALGQTDKEILIIDIEGLIELKNNVKHQDIISIFINVDYARRYERVKKRTDVDLDEFERRAKDDKTKKEKIIEVCDTMLENIELEKCIEEIVAILNSISSSPI